MKARTWNTAMIAAFVLIAAMSGFFAAADHFDLGDFDDFSFGDFDDFSFGDFDDFSFGDINDLRPGDFDDPRQEGATDQGTEDTGGFDPFDDDFGPLDDIPGNPQGTDFPPAPEEMPAIPPVIPPVPAPEPTPGRDDYLRIFIHQISVSYTHLTLPTIYSV